MRTSFDAYNHDKDIVFDVGVHSSGGTHWLRFNLDVNVVNGMSFNIFRDSPTEILEVLLELRNAVTTEIDRLAKVTT